MGELIQFIFNLENPVGRNIVWIILACFMAGILNYLWHIVVRLPWEWWNLHQAKTYIEKKSGIGDISGLLENLRDAGVQGRSVIYQRVADFVRIKQSGGHIDNDALADILIGKESRKASLANHTLGILIILGLIGTLWGLITALIKVQPLLTGIQDFEQLPEISETLKATVASMSTAFATTLTGLGTSLLLGFFGWGFNRFQSAFLTRFETYISTVLIPEFTQRADTSIESAVEPLSAAANMLEFATKENVRVIQQAIQQLTDTSWGGRLEQQYILANQFGTTAESLLESLTGINEYQVLIKTTVAQFQDLTTESMSQIKAYQVTLRQGLEDSVPKLQAESDALKEAIRAYQQSQSRFIDELSDTLQQQLHSITENQQHMVDVLTELAEQRQILPMLETQNQIFERIEIQLAENQQEAIHAFKQLEGTFQGSLRSAFEAQNAVFMDIQAQLTEDRQETIEALTHLTGELQIRSTLEAQNQVFERIENHLIGRRELDSEQRQLMQTLITKIQQLVEAPAVEINSTAGRDAPQQISPQLLSQISLKLDTLNQKFDILNNTTRQPGLYRWFSEIRRWFGGSP